VTEASRSHLQVRGILSGSRATRRVARAMVSDVKVT